MSVDRRRAEFRRILGIEFFGGRAARAVEMMRDGGLLVVPAAPALKDLGTDRQYREALLGADLTITDSAYMVLIWNLIASDRVIRLSGLEYLRELLLEPRIHAGGSTLWIMASPKSAELNLQWLAAQGVPITPDQLYMAPMYGRFIEDEALLEMIRRLRPRDIVVTIGGGTQERLGLYIKKNVDYRPAIHCIGAAIAFLSGDQVKIPVWADYFYLGWLYRCVSEPGRYIPRYWAARKLLGVMLRYRDELPPLSPNARP
jgi:UDP-N-acetyl-D-mannosaminuronic acid transferase (WecB/TagA/CpsF family)